MLWSNNQPRWGLLLYHRWCLCLLGSQLWHQIFVYQNSCTIDCARYFIRQHSRFARLSLPLCVFDCWWLWEIQLQSNTLTIREVCCGLVFVLLYSEFNEIAKIYCYKTVSIRVYQIKPDPLMIGEHIFCRKHLLNTV